MPALGKALPPARVDGPRLLYQLSTLAASATEHNGGPAVTRLAWSPADLRARSLLSSWAHEAGVVATCDAVGNLIAELPGKVPGLAPLATGSHLDTVVQGGPLDGAYGVVAAFEALGALARSGEQLRHSLRAVAFVNEEGVVAPAFTGSRAVAGEHIDLAALGPDGLSLADRIATSGGDPDALASTAWDRLAGYVELHIEQGPVLERQGAPIGIVSGISGCQRGWVSFDGEAGHAGTTPMDLRHDALLAAAQTVLLINAIAREGDIEVATAGALQVHPGNANVIARRASVSFDLRSMDDERASSAVERLRAGVVKIAASTSTSSAFSLTNSTSAMATDKVWHQAIAEVANGLNAETLEVASGAGHDAQQLARLAPIGMIFVPSAGGISHNAAETTGPDELVTGARVSLGSLRVADVCLDP